MKHDEGFTLLELTFALLITALASITVGHSVLRIVDEQHLLWNRDLLLQNFRWAQVKAYEQDAFTMVHLYPYTPVYDVANQWKVLHRYQFSDGIGYKGGYLALGSGRVTYGVNGVSHIGGTIRLTDKQSDELDIILYLNSGLAEEGELHR
ncbi:type II secretion system protein [Alicyclobacillus sp. SO9]|uniref:type II secretion system protein n=1 Tax=Alicyclobacillus sp. SO9 TaxID=2665646 RepID=UPI0018E9000A|nr:hypothetical protein [Alicyclobacillus sp. SO9]QQE76993.1 hypothetical protein GI364_13460 [Alicyclobacillus sp. SO9]